MCPACRESVRIPVYSPIGAPPIPAGRLIGAPVASQLGRPCAGKRVPLELREEWALVNEFILFEADRALLKLLRCGPPSPEGFIPEPPKGVYRSPKVWGRQALLKLLRCGPPSPKG